MAVSLLTYEISDLCLGKPPLKPLPICATIADALSALKRSRGDAYVSVWTSGKCIGKLSTVDVVLYLCRQENLSDHLSALAAPVSLLLNHLPQGAVRHVDPNISLVEALDLIVKEGAQNLVVPIIKNRKSSSRNVVVLKKQHLKINSSSNWGGEGEGEGEGEYCWLTQEDILRFLFSRIGLFSPLPARSLHSLGLIRTTPPHLLTVNCHQPASSATHAIALAHSLQTSVAVVSSDGKLIGEISPSTLAACNETVAPAIATLSAGDLMAYIDCGGPPRELVQAVKAILRERSADYSYSSSDDDEEEEESEGSSPTGPQSAVAAMVRSYSGSRWGSSSYSAVLVARAEAIVCHPESSLVAVMVQALVHRVNYVWVIDKHYTLLGIVTFSDVLSVLREHLQE